MLPTGDAEQRLADDLQGLVAEEAGSKEWARRLLNAVLYPITGTTWRLEHDLAGLARVWELSGRYPLVFLPAHRSYADSLLLDRTLRTTGLPRTYRLAGDNLSFWPLGALGRRTGTIFIKRDFGRDRTYHFAVRAYLAHLLERRAHLEWYPEAGRTRTGRLRRIRPGLLRILVSAFHDASIDDLYLIPVSTTYDVLPEACALVEEDRGGPKRAEGLSGMFRYFRTNRVARGGTARLVFGEPLSLRAQLASAGDAGDWAAVEMVTRELARRLATATPLTVESALALVLSEGERGAQSLRQIGRALEPLLAFAADRRIPVAGNDRLRGPRGLHAILERLVRAGVLTAVEGNFQPGYRIGAEQHQLAAYYRYTGSHWLVMRAIAELALLNGGDADPVARALRLRELLKHVFVLPEPGEFGEVLRGEVADLGHQPFLLAPRLLGPVLEAFYRVAVWLRDTPESLRDRRHWSCGEVFAGIDVSAVHWPESVSRELCRAALAAAAAEGLMGAKSAAARARSAFADELAVLVGQLAGSDAAPSLLRGLDERL